MEGDDLNLKNCWSWSVEWLIEKRWAVDREALSGLSRSESESRVRVNRGVEE